MNRPSKEKIDKILDPKKIAEFINKNGQLNTKTDYESSSLAFYLELDSWQWEEALLLLSGIQPSKVDYDYDDDGLVKIHHAEFLGRPDIYEVPSEAEILDWLEKCNEEYQTYKEKGNFGPKWEGELNAIYNNFGMYEGLLNNGYFNRVWAIRSQHAKRLTRYRLIWNSGTHEDRNSPGYYIEWALKKGYKIPWLEWAKNKGLLSTENTHYPVAHTRPKKLERSEDELKEAFDPVPLSTIANMFKLNTDEEKNLKQWRILAAKASRNGLNKTRVSTGKGKAESTFNPWLVGDWVIQNRGYTQEKVNRKLANNLPERSKDLKDLILL